MEPDAVPRALRRRDFIGYGALGGVALALDSSLGLAAPQTPAEGAVVPTTAGRIRGYVDGTVHTFKGVPYGATTAGAGRFMAPRKPEAWTGVRACVAYGGRAPQFVGGEPPEMIPTDPREAQSEDCLVLNVWTPALDGRRRPVMVWFHGGGFASGSGSYSIYSGRELARKHDVVAISVNHRLNIFGFLYLAEFGGKWADASNGGMLDLVLALEWVRQNASAFGGDPGNVTIFGQSGGGSKVATLMAMPSAKGLFHRAVAQSGSNVSAIAKEQAMGATDQVLRRLNITRDRLDALHQVPVEHLLAAMRPAPGETGRAPGFGPVIDGRTLSQGPFDPVASPLCASVPFLTGTTATETTFMTPDERLGAIDATELRTRVRNLLRVGDAADRVIALYRKNQPRRDDVDLFLRMDTDASFFRLGVDTQAERKATQQGAPVFMYRFEYYSPVRQGRLKAMHCMEIPFVFDNLAAGRQMTGESTSGQRIADQMSTAWVAFARTGSPNHRGIPTWTAFDSSTRATMVFGAGTDANVVNDPGGEERRALAALRRRA